jgi:glucosylceramidase
MKTNGRMAFGGRLREEYRGLWAEYYAKFLVEMKKRGVKVDALSVQNEPEATQIWESRRMSAEEEGEFIVKHLAPALKKYGVEDTKIVIWDHNKDKIERRARGTFGVPSAAALTWGVGYHWYVCKKAENLSKVKTLYPDKHILHTEGCIEFHNLKFKRSAAHGKTAAPDAPAYEGAWEHGEHYGRNIINDFNNFSEGWIDWNLVLDEKGGPNHVSNFCEAPVMLDTKKDTVIYNPSYYYIGHFSKFIRPGAVRLASVRTGNGKHVYSVSYRNPNGKIITVVQNEGKKPRSVAVCTGEKTLLFTLPENAIITIETDACDS